MRQQPRFGYQIGISVGFDRLFQNIARSPEEFRYCFLFESRSLCRWVDPCVEKNLIRIEISDARDQSLVEQNRFHRAMVLANDLFELQKADLERVSTQGAFLQKFINISEQTDFAEFALIVECESAVICEAEKDACIARRVLVIFEVMQRRGHAEMQSQPEISIDADKQMFAMSPTGYEAASFQPSRQLTRRDTFQNIRVSHIDIDDPLVQRRHVKIALEVLHLG
jgi:hypothetical protein